MNPTRGKRKYYYVLGGFLLTVGIGFGYMAWSSGLEQASVNKQAAVEATPTPTPAPRGAIEFRMLSLEQGWLQFRDGVMFTIDGGMHWQESENGLIPASLTSGAWNPLLVPDPNQKVASVSFAGKEYPVQQAQFLTDRIGWALVQHGGELKVPMLVTVDGGKTWQTEVTSEARTVMQKEDEHQKLLWKEAANYASPEAAKRVMSVETAFLPEVTYPGDVVLIRHNEPDEISWLGKIYPLQPSGAGYFTYLPIPRDMKAGEYTIFGKKLTVKAKKFDTQYLQVTQEMESMKQDTQRILADQKKIDLARSKSAPEFLFTSSFVQPVEGVLTTPYGYTRYVNNKLDSTHNAIDLAAKTGTPIKATNDGIVVLSELLYLTGNAIYIDHGMGLFSQYAHMSELKVKVGDHVKKGDIIGLVGTTGFSTGPHLHFTFWVHNIQANPNLFFNSSPFNWLSQ